MASSDRTDAGLTRSDEISVETYRRLHRRLSVQIRRMGVPPMDVEDLIQETFLNAQKGLDKGLFDRRSSIETWIVSIAKKLSLKYHRRMRAAKRSAVIVSIREDGGADGRVEASIPRSSEPSPQAQVSDRQEVRHVLGALRSLPASFREPLVLNVQGFSYDQIAALLQIPVSRVTSRIHQARAKLRKHLSGSAEGS